MALRNVTFSEEGRSGRAHYTEAAGQLSFYWEFGGGDVVAIVQAGTEQEWRARYAWAADRRSEILRFVAAEVVRQRAPSCRAEVNEGTGDILIRQVGAPSIGGKREVPQSQASKDRAEAAAWMKRYAKIRLIFALVVLVLAGVAAGAFWLKNEFLVIRPGPGMPLGTCVRSEGHISTLIQSLEPYTPSLHRSGAEDRYALSIYMLPLDGSAPRRVPVQGGLTPSTYSLSKILGSDGRTLWFDAAGLYGVALGNYDLRTTEDLRKANPNMAASWWEDTRDMELIGGRLRIISRDRTAAYEIDPETLKANAAEPRHSGAYPFAPQMTSYLAAGFYTSPSTWLGLHSTADLEGAFKPKRWLRPVENADDAKQLCKGKLDPVSEDASHRIIAMTPIADTEYLNASFLRMDAKAEPVRLRDPDGALMLFTSEAGLKGTLMIARVDNDGNIRWKVDSTLDRFKLAQILPGSTSTAFVGTRLPVPDKVSEPFIVIIDHDTGKLTTRSLWE